jgi:hypothetical protein
MKKPAKSKKASDAGIKELLKGKSLPKREDFPDDLWNAVQDHYKTITVLDTLREKYGDELVDLAIDWGLT